MFEPRPAQREVLRYKGGRMGVAAVPGSGKTRTLSYLAAQLVAEAGLHSDQEVLIVTLVNSAVDNFNRQVEDFIRTRGLLPGFGYRVRTLHGLANDIVRDRPGLVGLSESFQIVDERESDEILQDAVAAWLRENAAVLDPYINPVLDDVQRHHVRRNQLQELVLSTARVFIRQAKDLDQTAEQVVAALVESESLSLAQLCADIYVRYQRGLSYRGAVDFQDLIRLALRALEADRDYLTRLRYRWPFILEDEAQDSSLLQERILRRLAGSKGNWVRVGDPNQAIYETFTTAKPRYLREFLNSPGVLARELPNSGRSTYSIIRLANFLIDWTQRSHPVAEIRAMQPLQPPFIRETPPGDPQPNPPDNPNGIYLHGEALSPAEEINIVVQSLKRWVPHHSDQTVAVLAPRNQRGFEVIDALRAIREPRIECVELLRSTTTTREAARALGCILRYLASPESPGLLSAAFRVWAQRDHSDPEAEARISHWAKTLQSCRQPEDYAWPRPGSDWVEQATALTDDLELREALEQFRVVLRRWHVAVTLPIDQLIMALSQDLFRNSVDLAITHSIAVFMRRFAQQHPRAGITDFTAELESVAHNERRFLGLSDEDTGFDPDRYRGKVCVATIHSAKGLEWDRVYLISINNYDFPSAQPYDTYISEKWFVRHRLNLEAETLAQFRALIDQETYIEGAATAQARLDYAAERLRLLYVGITRARKELIITWNTGRQGNAQPALPYTALRAFWENRNRDNASRSSF
ncbi:MAG: ATP-dependent helicase [Aggregatilineales bacterium]